MEQIFQKNKVVTGKTPLFVIDPFWGRHSICLNIGFWQSSFEWKTWKKWKTINGFDVFSILVVPTKKKVLQVFEKGFRFPGNLLQSYSIENVWNFHLLSHKNMPISQKPNSSFVSYWKKRPLIFTAYLINQVFQTTVP